MPPDLNRIRDRIARKVSRLEEFSLVLARNEADARARERRGRRGAGVQYVIDTNILTTLIRPWQGRTSVDLFHAAPWTFEEAELDINSDAALVATELVLEVAKTANRGGIIFMTTAHHRELEHRVRKMLEALRETLSGSLEADFTASTEGLRAAFRLLEDFGAAREEIKNGPVVPLLADHPATEPDLPDWIVTDYITRRLCRALSTDSCIEPLDQIDRLQKAVLPRVGLIDILSDLPPSEAAEVERWERRIWDEVYVARSRYKDAAAMHGDEPDKGRPGEAVQADAEALAYLTWLNAQREADEPVYAFVTADKVLANAYRRWHLSEAAKGPYLVRQLNHFAPLFNLKDGGSAHKPGQEVFARTRIAIESLLIPFDLARTGQIGSISERELRSREAFALHAGYHGATDDEVFDGAFLLPHQANYMAEQEERLDGAVSPMRAIEHYAIGALPGLINNRLTKDKIDSLTNALPSDAGSDEKIQAWIEDRFRTIYGLSFQFAVQGAAASILAPNTTAYWKGLRREFRLRVQFGSEDVPMDQTAFLEHLHRQPKNEVLDILGTLQSKPHLIFALASVLAFQRQHWADAIRFAGLAASSVGIGSPALDVKADRDAVNECRYLKALSLRFRIGATTPLRERAFLPGVGEWRDAAVQELDAIIRDHTRCTGKEGRPLVRIFRAYSERAAVNLFYCDTACAYGIEFDPHPVQARLSLSSALRDALRDLRQCRRLERIVSDALKGVAPHPGHINRLELFDQVRRQYLANSVSARLIYHWLSTTPSLSGSPILAPDPTIERRLAGLHARFVLDQVSRDEAETEPIFMLYALAGDALAGDDVGEGVRRLERSLDVEGERRLPLDLALIKRFIRDVRAGGLRLRSDPG